LHDDLGPSLLVTGCGEAFRFRTARWRWLSPVPCFLGLAGIASRSLYITGTLSYAIDVPFLSVRSFNHLEDLFDHNQHILEGQFAAFFQNP
jgi:hypothetical protein